MLTVYKYICPSCGEEKESNRRKQKFCSTKCALEYQKKNKIGWRREREQSPKQETDATDFGNQ